MSNIIKYLGKEVRGLRTQGVYPVLSYSDRNLPMVMTDNIELVEVSNFEYIGKSDEQFDAVNTPYHYASTPIECIDAMKAAFGVEFVKHFCLGNVFKYLWRHDKKNKPKEDIQKCKRYLEMYLKYLEDVCEEDKC